jgi:DNA polymerase sigma
MQQEIMSFMKEVAPTKEEHRVRDAAMARIQAACADLQWYDVFVFGSKASSLELWNSDIDVVVTGLMEPSQENNGTVRQFFC